MWLRGSASGKVLKVRGSSPLTAIFGKGDYVVNHINIAGLKGAIFGKGGKEVTTVISEVGAYDIFFNN